MLIGMAHWMVTMLDIIAGVPIVATVIGVLAAFLSRIYVPRELRERGRRDTLAVLLRQVPMMSGQVWLYQRRWSIAKWLPISGLLLIAWSLLRPILI